jgi:hypothetical protein
VALTLACEYSALLDRIRVRKRVDMDTDDAGRKRVLDEIAEIEERIIQSFRSADRLAELRSMPYREYLKTPEWRSRRGEALARAGNRCQICNGSRDLDVHTEPTSGVAKS